MRTYIVCADASCDLVRAGFMCVHALCARVRMHYVRVCACIMSANVLCMCACIMYAHALCVCAHALCVCAHALFVRIICAPT